MMKFIQMVLLLSVFSSCSNGQSEQTLLEAKVFQDRIETTDNATIIDVRTPAEFSQGHLSKATNIDWTGSEFDAKISKLDKSNPYFVYCLSGGRSSSAAAHMRSLGFKEVYELDGGILKWRSNSLPEVTGTAKATVGMSLGDYQQLITDDKIVLVDFYAEWCGPCKKMKPFLDEISNEMDATVKIVRIDVDQNPDLAKSLKIDALPTIMIYEKGNSRWNTVGFTDKTTLLEHLK